MSLKSNVALIAVTCLAMAHAAAGDEPPSVIFSSKGFYGSFDTVHVEGTLTGEGLESKNNRSVVTCYRLRRECLALYIESEGLQVLAIGAPTSFKVDYWGADRILADIAVPCAEHAYTKLDQEWRGMAFATWVIDRTEQTATLISYSCLEAQARRWTIEDPPFWKEANSPARNMMPGLK